MRKAFDGLSGLVISVPGRDPLDGSMYIFLNKRKNRMKCLIWNGDGFRLFYKRLEKGTLQIPFHVTGEETIHLSYEQRMLILKGVDLSSIKHRS